MPQFHEQGIKIISGNLRGISRVNHTGQNYATTTKKLRKKSNIFLGQHRNNINQPANSKKTACKQKVVLIYEVEDAIAEYYKTIQLTQEFSDILRKKMLADIAEHKKHAAEERDDFKREYDKLKSRQKKLMEAYYEGVINKDLLREEQAAISKQITDTEERLAVSEEEYEVIERHLMNTLELAGNCYEAYKSAPDNVKRKFNQAFFGKIYVSPNKEDGTKVVISADLRPPFAGITKNHLCKFGKDLHYVGGFSCNDVVGAPGLEPGTNRL